MIYKNKFSTSSTGTVTTTLEVSTGRFRVHGLSVDGGAIHIERAYLSFQRAQGDGTYKNIRLASGFARAGKPLVMDGSRVIEGPGRLTAAMNHLGAAHTHSFYAAYEREIR